MSEDHMDRFIIAAEQVIQWRPKRGKKLGAEMQQLAKDIDSLRGALGDVIKSSSDVPTKEKR